MSYFAAAVVRGADGWDAAEIDLNGVADVDEVADRLRDVDPDAEVSLLFVESDDIYLAILRLDNGEDLRVFGSDPAFPEESRLGALLLGDVEEPAVEIDEPAPGAEPEDAAEADAGEEPEEELEEPGEPAGEADVVGDADLLADLGIPAGRLLELCTSEGMMPSDVTAEVCLALGCADEVEELREV